MKRVVTFVLLLVCIAGSVFAEEPKNLTVTLEVKYNPTFGFATKEVSVDDPQDQYIVAGSEKLISELKGTIYASAVTAAYGNVTLTVTYDTALKGQKEGNTYTIDLSLKNGEDAGSAGDEGKKVITLKETPPEKYQKRAINYPLEISYDTAQAANAPVDTYKATLTLAYSAT